MAYWSGCWVRTGQGFHGIWVRVSSSIWCPPHTYTVPEPLLNYAVQPHLFLTFSVSLNPPCIYSPGTPPQPWLSYRYQIFHHLPDPRSDPRYSSFFPGTTLPSTPTHRYEKSMPIRVVEIYHYLFNSFYGLCTVMLIPLQPIAAGEPNLGAAKWTEKNK